LRQWVLSVPFELRLLLARDPHVLTAVGRIFVQEIFRWQRERAGLSGLRSTASGAVCFPQRFGGSMNLNVHFHVAVPDGVFTAAKGAARANFWRLPTPDRLDVETLTVNVEVRVVSSIPCPRCRGPSGAVATLEVSTCTRASSSQPTIATAANGSFVIAPGPRSALSGSAC
ncbi:MAG TPA: transposase, partial [Polyangiaceae bacterium]